MGLEKVSITIEGTCDWCGNEYMRIERETYYHVTIGGCHPHDFCSEVCLEAAREKRDEERERNLQESLNRNFLGGYEEYEQARCFLCNRKPTYKANDSFEDHHIYSVDASPLRIQLCHNCHVSVHNTDWAKEKLIKLASECYGVELDGGKLAPKWGRPVLR